MPEIQRSQFIAFGLMGMLAGYPLLFEETLSPTGLITLYALAAFGTRTAFRWRSTKMLYQQLLLSYQCERLDLLAPPDGTDCGRALGRHSNRIGSSDGALLCAARLAEEEVCAPFPLSTSSLQYSVSPMRTFLAYDRCSSRRSSCCTRCCSRSCARPTAWPALPTSAPTT